MLLSLSAKETVECRIATNGVDKCNPYSAKLITAKVIEYQKNKQKLIVDKTLPVPKRSVRVISVVDMIEKYVKIDEPIRYEGSKERQLEKLNIENAKDNNRYTIARELKERREKFIKNLAALQKEAYAKQLQEAEVCLDTNISVTPSDVNKTVVVEVPKEVVEIKVPEEEIVKKEVPEEEIVEVIEKREGFYTVMKGETLGTIAKKFNLKTSELRTLNKLEEKAGVKVGQKLALPLEQEMVDIIASAEYIIKPGDSISVIARDFNLSSADILKYNRLKRTSTICIGKKLILPFSYKLPELKKKLKARLAKERKEARHNRMVKGFGKRKLRVTATAYSSHRGQTDKTPFLAAWNNRIRPGMKIIAVSRDMLTKYGLRNGSKVRIGGLRGLYTVRDKMNKRYRKRIDIYMGTNRRRALRWGRRSVVIYF